MNTDLRLLKAQHEALRNFFLSMLSTVYQGDTDRVWMAKFCIWRFERDNLAPYSSLCKPGAPGSERIDRRRFQLQVLMNVAYIQGRLEDRGVIWQISARDASISMDIYRKSDGSEETMLPLIDELY